MRVKRSVRVMGVWWKPDCCILVVRSCPQMCVVVAISCFEQVLKAVRLGGREVSLAARVTYKPHGRSRCYELRDVSKVSQNPFGSGQGVLIPGESSLPAENYFFVSHWPSLPFGIWQRQLSRILVRRSSGPIAFFRVRVGGRRFY